MPSRIVREGIISSTRIESLSMGAELLYRRLMSVVDDYGRFYGSVATIRGACWPIAPEKVSEQNIKNWLGECVATACGLILLYEVKGVRYLQLADFNQQIRTKSKFPDPDAGACAQSAINLISGREETACTSRIRISESYICASDDARAGFASQENPETRDLASQKGPSLAGRPNGAVLPMFDEEAETPDKPIEVDRPSEFPEKRKPVYNAVQVFHREFWPHRWRPQGKEGALKAFVNIAKTREIADKLIAALKAQSAYYLGCEQNKRPYMASWLNKKMFEDELAEAVECATASAGSSSRSNGSGGGVHYPPPPTYEKPADWKEDDDANY